MANQQILDYIKQQLNAGVSKDHIKSSLLSSGWNGNDINEAFNVNPQNIVPVPPPANVAPQAQPTSSSTSLFGAMDLFSQAWSVFSARIGTFVGIMIIPSLALIALVALLSFAAIFFLFAFKSNIVLLVVLVISIILIIILCQVWGQVALLCAVKSGEEKIGVGEAYRQAWHKIGSYFWVVFLTGLITMGGMLLLVIPGIIFAFWFSMSIFVFIAEDLKGMNALLKSKEYVRGKWGSVAWRGLFIIIVSIIISIILSMIVGILRIPYGSVIVRLISGLFVTPLTLIYLFMLYSNLREVRGDFVFAPTGGDKAKFILVGILGLLLTFGLGFLTFFLHPRASTTINSVNNPQTNFNLNGGNTFNISPYGATTVSKNDAVRRASLEEIQAVLRVYYAENKIYPSSLDSLAPKYIPAVPVDPATSQPYIYVPMQNGISYKVCAMMDSGSISCVTP